MPSSVGDGCPYKISTSQLRPWASGKIALSFIIVQACGSQAANLAFRWSEVTLEQIDIEVVCRNPLRLQDLIHGAGNVILTDNGKPFALVIPIHGDDDPAEMERIDLRVRAEMAIARIRRRLRS